MNTRGRKNKIISRQIDKKSTFQVRIDIGWKKILTLLRAESEMTIRALVEDALSNTYTIGKDGKPKRLEEQL